MKNLNPKVKMDTQIDQEDRKERDAFRKQILAENMATLDKMAAITKKQQAIRKQMRAAPIGSVERAALQHDGDQLSEELMDLDKEAKRRIAELETTMERLRAIASKEESDG